MSHFLKRCWSWISRDALVSWLISRIPKQKEKEPVEEPVKPAEKTDTEILIEKWETIDLSRIDRVFSSDMSMVAIELRKDKVIDYRAYLKTISDCYKRGLSCSRQNTVLPREMLKLQKFFLDDKGYYLDPLKETLLLQEEVLTFLGHYNVTDKNNDASYNARYNNNITRSLVTELADLYKVLSL